MLIAPSPGTATISVSSTAQTAGTVNQRLEVAALTDPGSGADTSRRRAGRQDNRPLQPTTTTAA